MATRWLIDYYLGASVLLIGSILLVMALVYSKTTNNYPLLQRLDRAASWYLGISVACVFFAMIAAYLPIFRLGAVV